MTGVPNDQGRSDRKTLPVVGQGRGGGRLALFLLVRLFSLWGIFFGLSLFLSFWVSGIFPLSLWRISELGKLPGLGDRGVLKGRPPPLTAPEKDPLH